MKFTEGKLGRVFIVRLEEGDRIPECIENFALEHGISAGQVILLGGIGGGQVVVGPRRSDQLAPEPMLLPVDGAHETVGAGLLAPDEDGRPVLHIHAALGRSGQTLTGCLRPGVDTWLVGEGVIYEITGSAARRIKDDKSGFVLLDTGTGL
ncbi:MAG: DNA-binding protein [Dehalococcoidales bacterium]|nr:DNA-binding protein [Dehalococcoidales bacterium]